MVQWGTMRLFARSLAVLLFLASSVFAANPTILNGDFESPVIPAPFISANPVAGWRHSGAQGLGYVMRVGYQDALGKATSAGTGKQFLLLGTGPETRADASWSTDITGLTPGVTYTLSFLMASQFPRLATTVTVNFPIGSDTPAENFTVSPFDLTYWTNWEQKQMNFVATAAVATVDFSVVEQRAELGLDNFTVAVAAPVLRPPSISNIALPIANGIVFSPGAPMLINGADLGTSPGDVASISIRGEAAPIIDFLNSGSLLVQVPLDLTPGPAAVTASHNGATTAQFFVTIAAFSPAIYYPGDSAFSDTAGNPITPSHLAIPGTPVTCIAIGLGPTIPPMITGVAATTAAPTTSAIQVNVGNSVVTPDSATLLVGSVTDYLVTFKPPFGIPAGAQAVTITLGGATSNTVTLFLGAPHPQITAVVNGASFKAGTVSPNSFVSLFGNSFGAADTTDIFPATDFNQVSVLVNASKVPLYAVSGSKGQINVVMPSEISEFGIALVEVSTQAGTSAAFQVNLAPDSVGIFRIPDPSNAQRNNGAVLFANSAWKVMPASMARALKLADCASVTKQSVCGQPAMVGDQIQIYLTGLGKATPNGDPNGAVLATGSLAPADGSVLYKTLDIPTVTIGGIPADVSFSGIAPGSAGQYQLNVAIPNGVEPGNDVPVKVTMPDGSTDTVTIAVK